MSAFMVPDEHLCLLVQAATQYRHGQHGTFCYYHFPEGAGEGKPYTRHEVRDYDETADETVAMLWRENVASLLYRYPESEPGFMVKPEADPPTYKAPHLGHVPPVLVLKALDCLEYQSCEHPGWQNSCARAFVERLRSQSIHDLPGYDDAPGWTYTKRAA